MAARDMSCVAATQSQPRGRGEASTTRGILPHAEVRVSVHAAGRSTERHGAPAERASSTLAVGGRRAQARPDEALDLAGAHAKDTAKSSTCDDAGFEESKTPAVLRVEQVVALEGLNSWDVEKAQYLNFTPLFWEPPMRNLREDASMVQEFCTSGKATSDKGKFAQFYAAKTVALAWRANALEIGVLGKSGDTQRFMWELAARPDGQKALDDTAAINTLQWHASGKSNQPPQWKRLGLQSMMAWRVLENAAKRGRPLTRALIEETHAALMDGAQRDDGPHSSGAVPAGVLRTEDVRAGDFVFPRHAVVPERLTALCAKFERDLATGHAVEAAALLLLAFVTLHPFVDGNGRTCRLLFAYALMRAGFPFPVVFSSGHKKAREHYMRALIAAQQRRHYWGVYAIAWASVVRCVNNYVVF